MSRALWVALCVALAGAAGSVAAAEPEFAVIVNAANPTTALPRETIARIFLKTTRSWGSGDAAKPVDLQVGTATREAFSRRVLEQSAGAVDAHWQRQIFSGRDVPPPRKASEAEVIEYVARNAGAIGYVTAGSSLPPSVKKLQIQ